MAAWQGKTRGGTLGYRIFIFTLQKLGLSPAYFLLRFVAAYYFLFSRTSSKHIYHYFHSVLGYAPLRARLAVYRNYYLFGQVLIDKVAILSGLKDKFSFEIGDEENLRNMTEGGLIISAHIGNWEMAPRLSDRIDRVFNVLMLDAEHQKIKEMLEAVMTERRMRVIPIKDDLSHLILIRQALSDRELIAMHGDRFMEGMKTLRATFLGRKALFPEGPFYLAARFNVPVSFAFVMKNGPRSYRFFASEARKYSIPKGKRISEEDFRPILEDYTGELQKILRIYPEQWFNYYGFWETEN